MTRLTAIASPTKSTSSGLHQREGTDIDELNTSGFGLEIGFGWRGPRLKDFVDLFFELRRCGVRIENGLVVKDGVGVN
jgi:hypothetical protein